MRRFGFVVATAVAMTALGAGLIPAIAQERGTVLYLAGPGFPESVLRTDEPIADHVTDLDRGREPSPGLTLAPGGNPTRETDDALHQDFAVDVSGHTLGAGTELEVWVAGPVAGHGVLVAHLLDCDRFGLECRDLGGSRVETAVTDDAFRPITLAIQNLSTVFAADRTLVLSITNDGEGDLRLGYDARTTPSRLTVQLTAPPPPTTTTSTTAQTATTVRRMPPSTFSVATVPPSTVPPPTVAPLVSTTTVHATTTTTTTTRSVGASGDEDVLTRLVFDYSMAAGATTTSDRPSADTLGRLLGVWDPVAGALGNAVPWLAALMVFAIGTVFAVTRRRASD